MEIRETKNDDIDLVQLAKVLIKRKWMIVGGTLLLTVLAIIIALLLPKTYKSEGFFQLSTGVDLQVDAIMEIQKKVQIGLHNNLLSSQTMRNNMLVDDILQNSSLMMKNVTIPDYKKYLAKITNTQYFLKYLNSLNKEGQKDLEELTQEARVSDILSQALTPVYAYTKKDLKDLAQISKDANNYLVGIKLYGECESPQKAQTFINILGAFIKSSILYEKMNNYIIEEYTRSSTQAKKYDNFLITASFKLNQLIQKSDAMRAIGKKYPASPVELISLGPTGHRFLSPTVQLVGIESYMIDLKENLVQNKRNKQLSDLRLQFFAKLKPILAEETFGSSHLAKCLDYKKTFFENPGAMPEDVIRQVKNELDVDFENISNLDTEMQFISGPTLIPKPIKPRKAVIAAVSFVFAFFLCIFMAFFVDWWQKNKKIIAE
ncbi:MAG: hypothetical protein GY757_07410 [bacterium]|nr:hypothetical protein [bacterium]